MSTKPYTSNREKTVRLPEKTQLNDGKLPPQARDLEEAVLGAMLLEKAAIPTVMGVLTTGDCFYDNRHAAIYAAILALFNASEPIDILTVKEKLKAKGKLEDAGGAYYISELTNKVVSAANVEHHARIVYQKYLQREVIVLANNLVNDAYNDTVDVFEQIDGAGMALIGLTKGLHREFVSLLQAQQRRYEQLEKAFQTGEDPGIMTGIKVLDETIYGLQPGTVTVFGARPGEGKTALAWQIAEHAANNGHAAAYMSLEMSHLQLANRQLAKTTGIPNSRLQRPSELTNPLLDRIADKAKEGPDNFYIHDQPISSPVQLRALAIRAVQQYGIKILVVDYLQLLRDDTKEKNSIREQEVAGYSRMCVSISLELDIAIVELAQLNRAVESRQDGKPKLSDLRESGSLEQDATNVIFLWNPAKYGISALTDNDGNEIAQLSRYNGIRFLLVAKGRNVNLPDGEARELPVRFIGHQTRFEDLKDWELQELLPHGIRQEDIDYDPDGHIEPNKDDDQLF